MGNIVVRDPIQEALRAGQLIWHGERARARIQAVGKWGDGSVLADGTPHDLAYIYRTLKRAGQFIGYPAADEGCVDLVCIVNPADASLMGKSAEINGHLKAMMHPPYFPKNAIWGLPQFYSSRCWRTEFIVFVGYAITDLGTATYGKRSGSAIVMRTDEYQQFMDLSNPAPQSLQSVVLVEGIS